jgi:hypothetical protein
MYFYASLQELVTGFYGNESMLNMHVKSRTLVQCSLSLMGEKLRRSQEFSERHKQFKDSSHDEITNEQNSHHFL